MKHRYILREKANKKYIIPITAEENHMRKNTRAIIRRG